MSAPTADQVTVRRHRGPARGGEAVIAEIVLDRPAAMNALSTAMAAQLTLACAGVAADRHVRAVVLSAAGDRARGRGLPGRRVRADGAGRIGLADRVVPSGTAVAAALELAAVLAGNSPVAVRAAKQALRNGSGVSLAAGLDIEDAAWRTAAFSVDRKEGIAAFNEKRDPNWPEMSP